MNERELVYQSRQAVYGLLQRLYEEAPDSALHNWLIAERPFAEFPIALNDEAGAALTQVDQSSQKNTFEELRQDYIQLYIGPGRMEVPPWESVYRNDERRLFDSHTLQVRETYARHGMEFVRKNKTPEDHIAIELEFMQIITERLLKALSMGDEKAERILLEEQLAFLKKHMLIWTPLFIDLTQKHAQTSFYKGLAEILGGFLKWEVDMLEQLMDILPEIVDPSP
jgi:putative dimethyl sulfoxide reductase chaperone